LNASARRSQQAFQFGSEREIDPADCRVSAMTATPAASSSVASCSANGVKVGVMDDQLPGGSGRGEQVAAGLRGICEVQEEHLHEDQVEACRERRGRDVRSLDVHDLAAERLEPMRLQIDG
jgi:hypothetical protein